MFARLWLKIPQHSTDLSSVPAFLKANNIIYDDDDLGPLCMMTTLLSCFHAFLFDLRDSGIFMDFYGSVTEENIKEGS